MKAHLEKLIQNHGEISPEFSVLFDALCEEIDNLEEEVAGLEQEKQDLEDEEEKLQHRIGELLSVIDDLETDIDEATIVETVKDQMKLDFFRENIDSITLEQLENLVK